MERLTYYERGYARYDFGGVQYQNEIATRLAAYEDIGLEPEEIKLLLDGLDDYRKVEAEGRLIVLPCKVGDTVYRVWLVKGQNPEITEHVMEKLDHIVLWLDRFGKTVFRTREEAETALERGTADGN